MWKGGGHIYVQVAFPLYLSVVLLVVWCVVFKACGNLVNSLPLQVEAQPVKASALLSGCFRGFAVVPF